MDLEFYDDDHLLDDQHHELIQKLVAFCGQQLALPDDTEMSITIVGDDAIQKINREYRDTDRATDVISFAIEDGEDDLPLLPGMAKNIGDLFIDPLTVRRHAKEYGHSFERELGYTVVQGFLHLNGYDHIKPEDEAVMIPLQKKILTAYGLTR